MPSHHGDQRIMRNALSFTPPPPPLQPAAMHEFTRLYLPDPRTRSHPDASPLLAGSTPGPPAPALIVLCQCDILQPQGLAYARKLRAQGADVQVSGCSLLPLPPHAPQLAFSALPSLSPPFHPLSPRGLQVVQVQGAPHGALNFQGTRAGTGTRALRRASLHA
jgi:acetyl esterase/lipase